MRLVTYKLDGAAKVGAWINGDRDIVDLAKAAAIGSQDVRFFNDMQSLIDGGEAALDLARKLASQGDGDALVSTDSVRILAPLPRPAQLRDFLSFPEHVLRCRMTAADLAIENAADPVAKRKEFEDSGFTNVPKGFYEFPVYYTCNRLTVSGPEDDIVWPTFSSFIDYELEWAAVIGGDCQNVAESDAAKHIFGYTIFNDWSARDEQMKAMGAAVNLGPGVGKDFANTLGPCIVTRDEIPDPYALAMRGYVNGNLISSGNTSGMHYSFEEIIAYITRGHGLFAGEVLGSGTVGTGCSLETRHQVLSGDLIELEIDSIGTLRNRVVAPHLAGAVSGGFGEAMAKAMQLAIKP
jgi:2-keto-4-pentenoate hydratase/2-oxohepta-3-ene-1,7-dioic acid hydratase in catechol pathway